MSALYRWGKRLLMFFASAIVFIFLILLPLGGSFLITNNRFQYRERGPKDPSEVGLQVTPVSFRSSEGIELSGWWNAGDISKPIIIFCHGLNRSRVEMLERAAEANQRGYGILLFDLRNHGQSARAYTTLGILESRDVCAASQAARDRAPERQQVLWGVSMGASTAILGAKQCRGFRAIIADSSFLSFRETVAHHLGLIFRLPAFPIAPMIIWLTGVRLGINPNDGDVEGAVQAIPDVPILFIAGDRDRRMPPVLAERLRKASVNPKSELLIVPGATHGEAYRTNRNLYMNAVFTFLSRAL